MAAKERIMIVDDDKSACITLELIFNKVGYITETVQTGKDAIEKVKGGSYNIILLDIRLPDTDGIQLISSLKELQPDMVVMMITGYASQETAIAALNKGASAYITKPFDMQEVLTIIRETFEKQLLVREKKLLHEQLQQELNERKKTEEALVQAKNSLAKKVEERTRDLFEEKQRIETVVETVPDGIAVIDREGNIYLVNRVFKDYYQRIYDADFPTSLKELSLLKNPFGDTVSKLFYSKTSESITIEPVKGLYLQLTSSRLILTPNTYLGVVISVHDVTPFVELDNLRKQFVSVVSHELRTPITAINLSLRNLQKFRKKISEEQLDEILNMTTDSAQVLTLMIEDLLVASSVEVGKIKLEWEPYQLSNIIKGVLNVLEPRRVSKSIALKVDINTKISLYGDEKRISQILRILVDNAIKYSEKESTVIIKARDNYRGEFNPTAQGGTLLQVVDYGRGIPEEDLPYIFDRFFRSKDISDKRGSGLGLSIAQDLISLHQGEIYVDSKHGKGSTFSVFLPRIVRLVEDNRSHNNKGQKQREDYEKATPVTN